ncbi:uncharacterized protein LOC129743418 [Uranotaenia lowii]|uniref:uncharacterized protein LOC129743418 n=1 Tax=Uranotaenia lowii TaxID=190385 RepID=UPI00247832D8|nr:uncharacterized protein LOC129743418 [Uranotaenia lowii]
MQSLESASCPEADYMLNDAYCKLRKSPSRQQTLLIDPPPQYPSLPSPILNDSTPLFNTSSSSSATSPLPSSSSYATLGSIHSTSPPATLLATPPSASSLCQVPPGSNTAAQLFKSSFSPASASTSSIISSNLPHVNHLHHHIEKRGATDSGYISGSPSKKSKLSSLAGASFTSSSGSSPINSSSIVGSCNYSIGGGTSSGSSSSHHHQQQQQQFGGGSSSYGYGAAAAASPSAGTSSAAVAGTSSAASPNVAAGGGRFNIHEKLRELYLELLAEDNTDTNRLNLRNTSFLLEKLVLRENLSTLILNLYPGNKGYSLAFRRGVEQQNDGGRSTAKSGAASSLLVDQLLPVCHTIVDRR